MLELRRLWQYRLTSLEGFELSVQRRRGIWIRRRPKALRIISSAFWSSFPRQTHLRRRMAAHKAVLLQRPVHRRVLLEVLKGRRRPAKRICHVPQKSSKSSRHAMLRPKARALKVKVDVNVNVNVRRWPWPALCDQMPRHVSRTLSAIAQTSRAKRNTAHETPNGQRQAHEIRSAL